MFPAMKLFRSFRPIYMNTINLKDCVQHRLPGNFYFFNVTEEAFHLDIHLMYAHKKEYRFESTLLTKSNICVTIDVDEGV